MGWKLTNSTPGGEGGGWLYPEAKAAWVQKVRESLNSAEVRERIAIGVRKAYQRPAMKENARQRAIQRWQDPEARKKMLGAMRAGMRTADGRANYAAAARERMARTGAKENVSAKLREYYATAEGRKKKAEVSNRPEHVKASRDGQIRNWSDPEYRKRIMSAKTSPEVMAKQKEKARQQWANPDVRERMLAAMKESRDKRKAEKQCK